MTYQSRARFEEKRSTPVIDFSHFSQRCAKSNPGGTALTRCGVTNCSTRAIATIESRPRCLEHLISHYYWRLHDYEQGAAGSAPGAAQSLWESRTNRFLDDCRSKIVGLLIVQTDLPNLERARLLDILLWATELTERRRCPIQKSAQAHRTNL